MVRMDYHQMKLNIVEDYTYSEAYANMGGEFESYEIDSEGESDPKTIMAP